MYCVVDASFVASWVLPDEGNSKGVAIAERIRLEGAAAPGLWQYEITNLMLMAERRGRITSAIRSQIISSLDALPFLIQPPLLHEQRDTALHLAIQHKLTVYDAAYLELALRLNLPLATLDKALRSAAKSEGLVVMP